MKDSLKKAMFWSAGCSSQFRSKYVFELMTHFNKSVLLECTIMRPTMEKVPWSVLAVQLKELFLGC